MNDILEFESHKFCEFFQMIIENGVHNIRDFINDKCERHHSQIPTMLEYCE